MIEFKQKISDEASYERVKLQNLKSLQRDYKLQNYKLNFKRRVTIDGNNENLKRIIGNFEKARKSADIVFNPTNLIGKRSMKRN